MRSAAAPGRELPITGPRKLRAALRGLDARQRRIVELRYGLGGSRPQTLREIGRQLGITGERVRQIEQQALKRLGNDGMPAAPPVRVVRRVRTSETVPRTPLRALALIQLRDQPARDQPAHGYDLIRRLDSLGVDGLGPRLYRLLRELEHSGLVRSDWTDSTIGPERRVYRLTSKGARQLLDDAQALHGHSLFETLQRFFEHDGQASDDRASIRPTPRVGGG